MYSGAREKAPKLFKALTGQYASRLLGLINYDLCPVSNPVRAFRRLSLDLTECVDPPEHFKSYRNIFERKIRYWDCRPMSDDSDAIVSPADSKVLIGSLSAQSGLFIKGKFFDLQELLGERKSGWIKEFNDGEFAIFRLTPEKYHYNHMPVSGILTDFYTISGSYHSCNPAAVIVTAAPYSKNTRVVSIIDTDVPGGSQVGTVAMIEVAALMVGDIVQSYSEERYENPRKLEIGMFLRKGRPKSLFRPGSSTDVLLFRKDRIEFSRDLTANCIRNDVNSRFSAGFGRPLVETDVKVGSTVAKAVRM